MTHYPTILPSSMSSTPSKHLLLTPAPAPCPLAQAVDTQLLASYTHTHTFSLMIDRRKERLCGLSSCERRYCVLVCACIHAYCDATWTTSALHFPIFRHHLDQNQFHLAYLILRPFVYKPEKLTSGSISPAGVISSSFLGGCVNLHHLLLVPTAHTSQTPNYTHSSVHLLGTKPDICSHVLAIGSEYVYVFNILLRICIKGDIHRRFQSEAKDIDYIFKFVIFKLIYKKLVQFVFIYVCQ